MTVPNYFASWGNVANEVVRGHAQVHRIDAARIAPRGAHALWHPFFMSSASERPIIAHCPNETPLCTCSVPTNTPLQKGTHTQKWKAPRQQTSKTPSSALSTGGRRGGDRRGSPHPSRLSGPSVQSVSHLKRERDALGAERRFSSMVAKLPRKSAALNGGRPFFFLDSRPCPSRSCRCWFQNTSTCMGREALDSGASPPYM